MDLEFKVTEDLNLNALGGTINRKWDRKPVFKVNWRADLRMEFEAETGSWV